MEDDTKPSTSNLPQTGDSQLEEEINVKFSAECSQMFNEGSDKIRSDQKAMILLTIVKASDTSEELRSFSIDRISHILTDYIHTWCSNELVPFCDEIIEIIHTKSGPKMCDKLNDILVKVTSHSIELNSGVEAYKSITTFIRSSVDTTNISLKQTALSLVMRIPKVFGVKRISDLRDFLQKTLMDSNSVIRFSALQTFFSVVDKESIAPLSALLPSVIQICVEFVRLNEESTSSFCPIESLSKMVTHYTGILQQHLTAIIDLCTVATTETNDQIMEQLILLMDNLLKTGNNADIDDVTHSKISRFILRAAPSKSNAVKRAALDVVVTIPAAFGIDCVSSIRGLISDRLCDADPLVLSAALLALYKLIRKNGKDKTYLRELASLMPKLFELGQIQACVVREYSAVDCIKNIGYTEGYDLLQDYHVPGYSMVSKILCGTNSLKENYCPLTESQSKDRVNTVDILNSFSGRRGDREAVKTEMIYLLRQQLTKAAYLEVDDEMRTNFMKTLPHHKSAKEEESCSEVLRRVKIGPVNDPNLDITLELIGHEALVGCSYDLLPFFEECFSHSNESIRSAAFRAFNNHCCKSKNNETIHNLGSLIPLVLKISQQGEPQSIMQFNGIFYIKELIQCAPRLFENHASEVVHLFLMIVNDASVRAIWRRIALEFIPKICKQLAEYLTPDLIQLIYSCFESTMSMLEEDRIAWLSRDDVDKLMYARERFAVCGAETMDAVVEALNGKIALPSNLDHEDWRKRHASVMCLAAMFKKSSKLTPDVVHNLIRKLSDSHHRVRAAACTALGKIFVTPNAIEQFHSIVIPALLTCLEDAPFPRVAATAAATLAQCCKTLPKPILDVHRTAVMQSALGVLEKTYQQLLEGEWTVILSKTVALIACANENSQLARDYKRLIIPLKAILTAPIECEILDAIALECVSLVGVAVGKRIFAPDAVEIMRSLVSRFGSLLASSISDLSPSFLRMVSAMGDSFLEFVPIVIPMILQAIRDMTITEFGRGLVEFEGGGGRVPVRQQAAFAMSHKLASLLGVSFAPYVLESTELVLAYLHLEEYDLSRVWACEMFPSILSCLKEQGGVERMNKLWTEYWQAIVPLIVSDRRENTAFKCKLMRSVRLCLEQIGFLGSEERGLIGEMMKREEEDRKKRSVERERSRKEQTETDVYSEEYRKKEEETDKKMGEEIIALEFALKRYY